jgi:hypothetical protein
MHNKPKFFKQTIYVSTWIWSSWDHYIGISRFFLHELAKTTMAPAWLEKPNQDQKPAGRLICVLQYNKLKVLSETQSASTSIGYSCEHYIGIFR